MKKLEVRDAHTTSTDKEVIAKIYTATPELHANAVVDFHDPNELELALRDTRSIFILVQDETPTVCGFAYVKIKDVTISKEKARLIHLVVTPEHRKSGAANLLMKEIVARLRAQGINDFYSCVNVKNGPMEEFLMKNGFKKKQLFHRFELDLRDHIPIDIDFDPADD